MNYRIINPQLGGPRKSFSRGSTRGSVRGGVILSGSGSDSGLTLSAVNEMNDQEDMYDDNSSLASETHGTFQFDWNNKICFEN